MDITQKIREQLDIIKDTERMLKQIEDVKKIMEIIEKYQPKRISRVCTSPYQPG